MRFQAISDTGYVLGLASHLSSEGHAVALSLAKDSTLGEGVVSKTTQDTSADVLLFDSDSYGSEADLLRQEGKRVIGSSMWSKILEEDSSYATNIIKSLGWPVSDSTQGINLYITGWFNGDRYISIYTSLVYRRLMSSGGGPDLAFTGVVSNFWVGNDSKVMSLILNPLSKVLKKANHRGAFHVHVLVNRDSYSVKEVSASFSHPLNLLLFENSKLTTSDILLRLLNEDSQPIVPTEQWGCGVLLSVPPFPYVIPTIEGEETILKGIQPANLKHLWLVDVQKAGDVWLWAHTHGKLGYVTSRGCNVNEAARRAYRTISNLNIRDLQYRDDIGRNIYRLTEVLKKEQWLN